jgi:hypothetical protein
LVNEEQNPRRCDFFVSYTGVDTAWAEWIAWQLKKAGYTVTIQAWHFRPGMNFVALMGQALDRCQRTVAVVSRAYLDQSAYGSDEWTAAFTHDDPASFGRSGAGAGSRPAAGGGAARPGRADHGAGLSRPFWAWAGSGGGAAVPRPPSQGSEPASA